MRSFFRDLVVKLIVAALIAGLTAGVNWWLSRRSLTEAFLDTSGYSESCGPLTIEHIEARNSSRFVLSPVVFRGIARGRLLAAGSRHGSRESQLSYLNVTPLWADSLAPKESVAFVCVLTGGGLDTDPRRQFEAAYNSLDDTGRIRRRIVPVRTQAEAQLARLKNIGWFVLLLLALGGAVQLAWWLIARHRRSTGAAAGAAR